MILSDSTILYIYIYTQSINIILYCSHETHTVHVGYTLVSDCLYQCVVGTLSHTQNLYDSSIIQDTHTGLVYHTEPMGQFLLYTRKCLLLTVDNKYTFPTVP